MTELFKSGRWYFFIIGCLISKDGWVAFLRHFIRFRMCPTSWIQESSRSNSRDDFRKSFFACPAVCNAAARQGAVLSPGSAQSALHRWEKWPLLSVLQPEHRRTTGRSSGLLGGARMQMEYGDYRLTMLLLLDFVPVPMLTPLLINYFGFFLPPRCLIPSMGTHAAGGEAVAPKPVFYSRCVFERVIENLFCHWSRSVLSCTTKSAATLV